MIIVENRDSQFGFNKNNSRTSVSLCQTYVRLYQALVSLSQPGQVLVSRQILVMAGYDGLLVLPSFS